jgi:SAM-dependent methyltransferase
MRLHLTAAEIQRDFRRHGPSGDGVQGNDDWMAPGGLVLAQLMAEQLAPKCGERILDLGCGQGQSSVYLAARYGVHVVSVDLWISADERNRRALEAGVDSRVVSLQGNISRGLPPGFGSFDAIFCLQAFHCFGANRGTFRYLASLLKSGGMLCFAQGCFRHEPEELPLLFQDTGGWKVDYRNYHSAGWWRDHVAASGLFDVMTAEEIEGGQVLWEDDVLRRGDRAGWSEAFLSNSQWLIRQIAHGQTSSPTLTHCIVCAKRKA